MIYLAESGSTKCDAVFLSDDGTEIERINTMGFNPYFHDADLVEREMKKHERVQKYRDQVTRVYFFGAGCSSPKLNTKIEEGLRRVFENAKVEVDHDLVACAYATYSGEPAISCILGTGSNSVFFDGAKTREEVPALAFILGDEGSASYLGKRMVADYLYKRLPERAHRDFKDSYQLSKDDVVERVYNRPHANVWLAGFAPFASKHIDLPYFWDLVFTGFKTFLEIHVKCFPEHREVPVHFVGSIAYYFQDILDCALQDLNLRKGQLIQKPLDGLIEYHRKNVLQSPRSHKTA